MEIAPEKMVLFKGMLFEYSLTAHQMIDFVTELWAEHDEDLMNILERRGGYKRKKILDGTAKTILADDIYKLIEQENEAKLSK